MMDKQTIDRIIYLRGDINGRIVGELANGKIARCRSNNKNITEGYYFITDLVEKDLSASILVKKVPSSVISTEAITKLFMDNPEIEDVVIARTQTGDLVTHVTSKQYEYLYYMNDQNEPELYILAGTNNRYGLQNYAVVPSNKTSDHLANLRGLYLGFCFSRYCLAQYDEPKMTVIRDLGLEGKVHHIQLPTAKAFIPLIAHKSKLVSLTKEDLIKIQEYNAKCVYHWDTQKDATPYITNQMNKYKALLEMSVR